MRSHVLAVAFLASTALAQTGSLHAVELAKFGGHVAVANGNHFGREIFLDGTAALVMHSPFASSSGMQAFDFNGAGWAFDSELPFHASRYTTSFRSGLVVAGAPGALYFAGRVYVMRDLGASWDVQELLSPDAWTGTDSYGSATRIDGAWIYVSAPLLTVNHDQEGALYAYELVNGAAVLRQSLYGGADDAQLGWRFAVQGEQLLATVHGASGWTLRSFRRDANVWSTQQAFVGPTAATNWHALELDRGIAVATRLDGTAWALASAGGDWHVDAQLVPTGAAGVMGYDAAVADGVIAISSPEDGTLATSAGAVQLFARNDGWRWMETLTASDGAASDLFGYGIDADGRRMLVGALNHDGFGSDVGAVYEFRFEHTDGRVHCVAGPDASGCVARIGFSGTPSAASGLPYLVTASSVRAQRNAALVYGTNGALFEPFPGGVQCIAAPRTLVARQASGGTSGCDGSLAFDFNALIRSGVDPALLPGHTAQAQWIFRDPAGPTTLATSEALEIPIQL